MSSTFIDTHLYVVRPTINITMIYMNIKLCRDIAKLKDDGRPKWILLSYGPDFRKGPDPRTGLDWGVGSYATSNADPAHHFDAWNYDSSNGTISGGDIIKHQ
jgi:hypothetical protein